MQQESPASTDIGLGVVLIVIALITIVGTLELPEGSFEPLGSASIPQYVSGGIIALSIWIIVRALGRIRASGSAAREQDPAQEAGYRPRPGLAAVLVIMAVVYVGVMAMDWLRFSIATAIFLLASVGMLTNFERGRMPAIIVLALVLGIGLEYVFTQVFVIDLP